MLLKLNIKQKATRVTHYRWWSSAPQPVPQMHYIITVVKIPWGFGGKAP